MVKWLSVLLLALPLALVGELLNWRPALLFGLALVSLVPLAAIISDYTRQIGEYLGEIVGGLLNATFGNAPEIILGVLLIVNDFNIVDTPVIIKGLIVGSIVSNALFVLGSSIFVGAIRNGRMRFSADHAGSYASMLALAVVGLALPALAAFLGNNGVKLESQQSLLDLSAVVSVVLLVCYFAYLAATIFGVGERAHGKQEEGGESEEGAGGAASAAQPGNDPEAARRALREKRRGHGREIGLAFLVVAGATILIVVASAVLLSEMNEVMRRTGLTPFFVGFILLPFVTNAAEQMGAIVAAVQNRMEEAMSVAAGSGVQVALLVAPLLMLASLALGNPLQNGLVFTKGELVIVTLATFVYALVSLDGETTWLEGLQLIAVYVMVAAAAFFAVLPAT